MNEEDSGVQDEVLEGFPLSPQQRHFWLSAPASARYCSQCAIRIDGGASPALVESVVRTIVARHESLRTTFRFLPGMDVPIQVILEDPDIHFEVRRLAGAPDMGKAVGDHLRRDARTASKDGDKAFPARFVFLEFAADKSALLITLSPMNADAASLANICAELAALCADGQIGAADTIVQYADYSEWQNELVANRDSKPAYSTGAPSDGPASLPLEPAPDDAPGEMGATVTATLDPSLTGRLKALSSERGADLRSAVLAGFGVLIWRLREQRAPTLGILFEGRLMQGLDNAVGLFAKYLPAAFRIEDNYTFTDVLRRTVEALASAEAGQDDYAPGSPMTQAGASARRAPEPIKIEWRSAQEQIQGGDLQFSLLHLSSAIDPFDLKLTCVETDEAVGLHFDYDPAVYSHGSVSLLAERFTTLLADIAAAPDRPVKSASLLPPSERRRVLEEWNETGVSFPRDLCLHEIFETRAAGAPDADAVRCERASFTFAALNARAERLACALRRLGVGPEVVVGLCLEPSCLALAAILGIWKAGGAYAPIDPGQPRERLAFVAAGAGCRAIVTQSSLADTVSDAIDLPLIRVDSENDYSGKDHFCTDDEAPQMRVSPDNLAYVIYTSGSTGKPQGVMVRHRSAVNLAFALQRQVYGETGARLTVGVNAPLVFDASVKQLIQALNGHCICFIPERLRRDPAGLVAYLDAHRVDAMDCTPSQINLWLAAGMAQTLEGLPSTLLIGGEALDETLWRLLRDAPGKRCYNVYGPTECTVDATIDEIREDAPTIGAPVANARAYVLDETLRPTPTGLTGQLYVGGEGLARGYLNRPDLTAGRFLPDPYAAAPGARMYRTGDMVRRRGDGRLDYVGRCDHQIKLQGIRIELPEIEKALRDHPAVREAAVVVATGKRNVPRLIGYVLPQRRNMKKIDGQARRTLPNGRAVAHRNKNETDYLYKEIFEQQTYLRHGLAIPEKAVVFDIGANIGLFSLFVAEHFPDAAIYAFEPVPPIFNVCRINAELYAPSVKLFPFGLSSRNETTGFTYYPHYSVMSGRTGYSNADADIDVIKRYLENREAEAPGEAGELMEHADELLAGRFMAETYECALRRLSDVIAGEQVERIDLLKIDVQRAELDVLEGIDDAHWPKIRQVVMEAHDAPGSEMEGRLREISALLERHGFETLAVQDEELSGTDRYNFYASRDGLHPEDAGQRIALCKGDSSADILTAEDLRAFLKEKLPDYMTPAAVALLDEMPLTRNGKIDRAALAASDSAMTRDGEDYLAPQTGLEKKVAAIWRQVLDLEQVGLQDNFFDLGGHSLLLVQLHRRLCEAFEADISMIDVFEHPTVAALAELLRGKSDDAAPAAKFDGAQARAGKIRKAVKQRKQASKGRKGR